MKREGRQHGMVRTYRILPSPYNPRPDSRLVNRMDSPPTAGLFTKVHPRPTNHSKFTGKCGKPRCGECHMHPSCKSKDKTKGTHKIKSHDVLSNHRLISWRVVDGKPGLNFSGFSATGLLNQMDDREDDDDLDYRNDYDSDWSCYDDEENNGSPEEEEDDDDDDDDDHRSYSDVGFVLDQVEGEEGWCLVAAI